MRAVLAALTLLALAACEGVAGLDDLVIDPAATGGGSSVGVTSSGGSGGDGGSPGGQGPGPTAGGGGGGPCDPGYTPSGGVCVDVDECARPDTCGANASCENLEGSFVCTCDVGFEGDGQVCTPFDSCLALATAQPTAPDGVYTLNAGGLIEAYCDVAGGGWTLVMTLTSGSETFAYDSPHWETATTHADTNPAPVTAANAGVDAKYAAFNQVSGSELRLAFLDPVHELIYPSLGGTALALFQGGEDAVVADENGCGGNILNTAPGYTPLTMRHGQGHQFYGINGADSGGTGDSFVRFGFASNDEPDNAWQPHQAIGVLIDFAPSEGLPDQRPGLIWRDQADCNDATCGGCYGSAYQPTVTAANLWVR